MPKISKTLIVCPAVARLNWLREFNSLSTATLRPHQFEGAKWLAEDLDGLLHWDMRVGKTYAALGAIALRKGVRPTELPSYYSAKAVFKRKDVVQTIRDTDITIISYDMLTDALEDIYLHIKDAVFDTLILDESQYLKNIKSHRTKAVFGIGGLASKAEAVYLLSGTPMPNNLTEIYPWLKSRLSDLITDGKRSFNIHRFTNKYCVTRYNGWADVVVGNKIGAVEELMKSLKPYIHRLRREDVFENAPLLQVTQYPLETSLSKDVENNLQAVADFLDYIDSDPDPDLTSPPEAVTTVLRETEYAKAEEAAKLAIESLESGMTKLVIFAQYLSTIDAMRQCLSKYNPVSITGGTSAIQRDEVIDRFNNDANCRVFIGQIQAAGTAISLHANGDCVDAMFMSASWVPAVNAQAAARIWRLETDKTLMAHFLYVDGSIDEAVTSALIRKTKMLDEISAM